MTDRPCLRLDSFAATVRWLVLTLCLCLAQTGWAAEKQKVLFDCDLAGDVDDAFAVGLLLASPEFEVLGLVMDHGNTAKRAQVACRLLYQLGLDQVPVAIGRATPSVVGEQEGIAGDSNQFVWGQGFEQLKPIAQPGADFIIEQLRSTLARSLSSQSVRSATCRMSSKRIRTRKARQADRFDVWLVLHGVCRRARAGRRVECARRRRGSQAFCGERGQDNLCRARRDDDGQA